MTFKKFVNWFEYAAAALAVVTIGMMLFYEPAKPKPATSVAAGASNLGLSVYTNNCVTCHGSKGQGGIGAALWKGAVKARYPDIQSEIKVVQVGTRSGMPAWQTQLTPEEIQAVVEYTRTL